jgi:sugar phosphate isomerase/epimerase
MESLHHIIQKVQVNIPFTMLWETYLDTFIENGLNPEIGLDAEALDRFSIADFTGIAQEFRQCSRIVTLHGPFVDLNPGSPDPAVRRLTRSRLDQLLELVPVFQPLSVVCHANFDDRQYGYYKESWIEKSLESWSWVADRVAAHGSRLMLENVFEEGPEDMKVLFDNLRHQKVGFCLDTGHAAAFGQSDLAEWLNLLGPFLGQLHLHDNLGKKDDHLAIGSGIIEFNEFFRHLRESVNPPPIITLEPHEEKHLWPSLENLAQFWPW